MSLTRSARTFEATFSTDAAQNCRMVDLIEVNYILILRQRRRRARVRYMCVTIDREANTRASLCNLSKGARSAARGIRVIRGLYYLKRIGARRPRRLMPRMFCHPKCIIRKRRRLFECSPQFSSSGLFSLSLSFSPNFPANYH